MPQEKVVTADKAKSYSRIKYSLSIIEIAYLLILLFLFQGLGISKILAEKISNFLNPNYIIVSVYIFIIYFVYYLLNFPLNLYQSFILEHQFSLSQQKIKDWLKDQAKAGVISFVIAIILAGAFYYILKRFNNTWWIIVSLFWIFFSLILAKLMPVVIIPLFFKYHRLSDDTLRARIMNLAEKMQVKILDCFEIDFSKKTLKANAAFVGIGNTKRVILSDTLKDKYGYDEIEAILAHEFAHYRLKHLLKLISLNSLFIIFAFYLIFKTSHQALGFFSLSSLSDIAALPVVLIYFVILGIVMQPFQAYISRRLERNADMLAIKVTGLKEAFISTMDKLANQNLADRNPHPVIKFFFFDHPPIDERIAMARSL